MRKEKNGEKRKEKKRKEKERKEKKEKGEGKEGRERGKEGKRERGKEGKRERGKEGKGERGKEKYNKLGDFLCPNEKQRSFFGFTRRINRKLRVNEGKMISVIQLIVFLCCRRGELFSLQ